MHQSGHEQKKANPFDVIRLVNKIHGSIHTQLISTAAKLGIADLLADGSKSVEELAKATGTIEDRLYRILRALASLGIFAETTPQHFDSTALTKLLRKDYPGSLRNLAIMLGSEWHVRTWANIMHSLENRESAFEGVHKRSLFDYLQDHPEDAAVFNSTMTSTSQKQAATICRAYDFPQFGTVVDVGGGHGFLLSQILKAHPNLSGVLFDSPSVVKDASPFLESEGLTKRCEIKEGSFFEGIPPGGDIYILKHIIHDYDDNDALTILRNCSNVMNSDNRILVIEIILKHGNLHFFNSWMDVEMMVLLNGKERTETEYKNLLSRAGLKLNRIIPTRSEVSIVEGAL